MLHCPNTHTHTTVLQPFFQDYPGELVPENLVLDFMVQGEISEADTPTIRLGATPSRLISDPPSLSPIFKPDALPVATLPIFRGLRQAPNMLVAYLVPVAWLYPVAWFISSGLMKMFHYPK